MIIKLATATDLDEVSSWLATATDCRMWAGPMVTFPIDKSMLASEIMFGQDNSYCCNTDIGLAGFGQLIQINDVCFHLARIITNPKCRGQGVARKLCAQLVHNAWRRGGSQVSLNVYRGNVQALTLYQSLGFREHAERSDENMLYMLKLKGA